MNCSECHEPMTQLDPREITDPQPSRFVPRWRCDIMDCPRQGEVVEETAASWRAFGQVEKHGRCQFCNCDGLLTYIDPLEMWLCFDWEPWLRGKPGKRPSDRVHYHVLFWRELVQASL